MESSFRETLTLSRVVSASLSGDNFLLNISNADAIVVWCLDVPFCLPILDEYENCFYLFFTLSDFTLYEALFESSSVSGKEILSVVVFNEGCCV